MLNAIDNDNMPNYSNPISFAKSLAKLRALKQSHLFTFLIIIVHLLLNKLPYEHLKHNYEVVIYKNVFKATNYYMK